MSKNTQISELINYISVNESGNVVFTTVPAATTNTNKFLVSDAGTLKFRTAAQLLSDIGAQASGSYQAALSGTGFVKISGSTISYDNSTYLTTSSASSTYLPLVGGALTGGLTGTTASFSSFITAQSTGGSGLRIYGSSGTNQWDVYLNSTNIRFSDNTGTGSVVFDRPISGTSAGFSSSVTAVSGVYVQASNNSDLPFINFSNSGGVYNWGRIGGLLQGDGDGSLYFQTKLGGSLGTRLTITSTGASTFTSSVGVGGSPTGTYGTLSVFGGISTKDNNNGKLEIGRYSSGSSNSYIKLGANSNSLRITNKNDTADIFTIENDGNVGIGTNTPKSYSTIRFLTIDGVGGSAVTFYRNGIESGEIQNSNAGAFTYTNNAGHYFMGGIMLVGTTTSTGYGVLNTYKAPIASNYVDQIVVQSTGNYPSLRLGTYDAYDAVIATTGNDLRILSGLNVTTEDHNIMFYTSFNGGTTGAQNYERMRIAYNGYVGIGTNGPPEPLSVSFSSHGLISQHRKSNGIGVGQNFYMKFNNASGNAVNYAGIYADVQANTDSAHSGRMILQVANAGSLLSAVIIANNGNVGIGGAPQGILDVYKSTTGGLGGHIMLRNNGAAVGNEEAIMFVDGDAGTTRAAISSTTEGAPYFGDIKFKTGLGTYASLTTRMTITGSGRVGVNTTATPETSLHVTDPNSDTVMKLGGGGAARDCNFSMFSQSASNTVTAIHYNGQMAFYSGKFNIASSGSATLTGTLTQNSSDTRLKENIIPISNALSKIEQLTGFTYTWNQLANSLTGFNTSTQEVGLSAQSVQSVLPEAVFAAPFDNEFDPSTQSYKSKSGQNYLTIQYEKLVPLLVEAIKELKTENDSLKDILNRNNII